MLKFLDSIVVPRNLQYWRVWGVPEPLFFMVEGGLSSNPCFVSYKKMRPWDAFLGLLAPSWGRPGALLGRLGRLWGRLEALLGRPGAVLGSSWSHLGAILGPSWARLGAWVRSDVLQAGGWRVPGRGRGGVNPSPIGL